MSNKTTFRHGIRHAQALIQALEHKGVTVTRCAVIVDGSSYEDADVYVFSDPTWQDIPALVKSVQNSSEALDANGIRVRFSFINRCEEGKIPYDLPELPQRVVHVPVVRDWTEGKTQCYAAWVRYLDLPPKECR